MRSSISPYSTATTFLDMLNQWVLCLAKKYCASDTRLLTLNVATQVVPDNQNRALYSTHTFKILFKEGGCGTFVPLFLNLVASVRRYNQFEAQSAANMAPRVDPLQAAQTPVDEMMRHAWVLESSKSVLFCPWLSIYPLGTQLLMDMCRYVDPNDPTKIFLQQPAPESQLRRRNYHGPADNA